MKKFYLSLITLLALCLCFTACSDKEKTPASGTPIAAKSTATALLATQPPKATATTAPAENASVAITVEDLVYTYVLDVKYKDNTETWEKVIPAESTGLDIDEMAINLLVPNDGSEVEITAVLQEGAPYKIKGWSGDVTAEGETIKFTPSKAAIHLNIDVEPLYGENLALDATVTCSVGTEENTGARWGKALLTDGDINTRFSTTPLSNVDEDTTELAEPATIDIDLGSAKRFDIISLFPRTDTVDLEDGVPNYPFAFEILVSSDGITYTSVKTVSLEENVNNMVQSYDVGTQTAQYIRLSITKVGNIAADEGVAVTPYRIQFADLMVFAKS
ncbi:MAG: discoidin domain-containing protein [Clostridiales bacterium]|nr:discoidin domain-containing protein [Clostridiales bacterium]